VSSADARYWLGVGEAWTGSGRDRLWRQHCDGVNARLLARWLPATAVPRLLKTDLFDEALTGGLDPTLRERSDLVVGMDLSQAIARNAAQRCPVLRSVRADVRHLPFADGAFDVVVSLSTLDHFHTENELAGSLRELGRVLRPDGLLLLTLDNPENPLVALRNALPFALLNRLGIVPYFVGATCGARRLPSLLERAGFVVLETDAVMHCVRVLAVPLCRLVDHIAGQVPRRALMRLLMGAEHLAKLPSRFATGSFVAVLARKTSDPPG
jgi:SAM-dependent methyltransferase